MSCGRVHTAKYNVAVDAVGVMIGVKGCKVDGEQVLVNDLVLEHGRHQGWDHGTVRIVIRTQDIGAYTQRQVNVEMYTALLRYQDQ